MLLPCDLPSIRQFAGDLFSVLDEGELVILGCPAGPNCEHWANGILDALEETVHSRDGLPLIRLPCFRGDTDDPEPEVARALGRPDDASVSEFLESFSGETITILTIDCADGISDGWRRLFTQIGKIYKTADSAYVPILTVLIGCRTFPPVDPGVGIRVRALWNVVRWEELRLLVESMLTADENALVRAWRIAVYSATSNSNPDLVSLLCRNMPNSLSETIETTLDRTGCSSTTHATPVMLSVSDQRWDVPPAVVRDWAEGRVAGITLERGASLNIKCMKREDAHAYLLDAISREQIAGLLPVVMEMGFSVAQAVKNAIGDRWLDGSPDVARGPGGRVNLEPAEIIERLQRPSTTYVPEALWQILLLLRKTRNDLAHMDPVDYGRIRELWQMYDRVRHRFAKDRNAP